MSTESEYGSQEKKLDCDVLIVGAGIAGISAGTHLRRHAPDSSFLILERRAEIGGTWDLFRYPGVRSDSDMYSLGFGFRPWMGDDAVAEGSDILAYLRETADAEGLLRHIRTGHALISADWSSEDRCWIATVEVAGERRILQSRLLHMCSGYYDYSEGYLPDFRDRDKFLGRLIHPQHWPSGLSVVNRRVAVIGSGATAVTLAPALAEQGAKVTLIQRSPGYFYGEARRDRLAMLLQRLLGRERAYRLIRWRNIHIQRLFFRLVRKHPQWARRFLIGKAARAMPGVDVEPHLTPRYNPWEQRLCLVPDGDFFEAVNRGDVRLVTGKIERFEEQGLRLADGSMVEADIVVAATGLNIQLFGGARLSVNGKELKPSQHVLYKGVMLDDVPNLLLTFGYTNASWTLKADVVGAFLARLANAMRDKGADMAVPGPVDATMKRLRMIDFSSGYFLRARHMWPKQGEEGPWTLPQDFRIDRRRLLREPVEDGVLTLS